MDSAGNNTPDRHACLLHFRSDLVPYTLIVVIESLFNLLIVVAITFNRSKLKHNHVYSYVTSVVMANVALGILFTYTLVNYMIAFERTEFSHNLNASNRFHQDNISQRSIMTWWAFRKAFMVAFFLILSGNVSALIHGIANSAYFVGRSGGSGAKLRFRILSSSNGSSPTRGENYGTVLYSRKRRAYLTIFLTWVLPFFYSLPAAFGWNCIAHCDCLPGYYGGYRCISRQDPALCSRIWSPMTNAHLLLAAIIWFVELIMIGVNLFYALHKYYHTSVKPSSSVSFSKIDAEDMTVANNHNDQRVKLSYDRTSAERNSTHRRLYKRPLHPTVKLLVLISAAYALTTTPVMICVVTDFIGSTTQGATLVSDMLMTALSSLVVLYCFVCPVILIKYMPGLRTAIVRLLMPCSCVSNKSGSSVVRARVSRKKNQVNGTQ